MFALFEMLKKIFFLAGYFSNGSYPKPLSPEEEALCLEKMHKGSKSARDKLICHNMRLVAHVAKKYGKNDMDDLISIGSIGLIKGVESYSTSKGTTLATYLARCIENEILMNLRANKKYQNTVYLQNTLGIDNDGNEYTLMDVLAVKEDSVFHQAEISILRDNLLKLIKEHLTEQERKIILLRYGIEEGATPLTQLQTAKIMGISRSYISRIETRALEKLRKQIKQ